MKNLTRDSLSIERDKLLLYVARIFGFERAGNHNQNALEGAFEEVVGDGRSGAFGRSSVVSKLGNEILHYLYKAFKYSTAQGLVLACALNPNRLTSVMQIRAALATLFFLLAPAVSNATELKQETLTAWDAYMRAANLQLEERLNNNSPFLWIDESPERSRRVRQVGFLISPMRDANPEIVPNGLIHHWIGAMFVANVTIGDALSVARDYERYKEFYGPTVINSKLIARNGADYTVSILGLKRVLFETIVLQSEFQSSCSESDAKRAYCISYSTRIEEI